jgi:hypothetical protein
MPTANTFLPQSAGVYDSKSIGFLGISVLGRTDPPFENFFVLLPL